MDEEGGGFSLTRNLRRPRRGPKYEALPSSIPSPEETSSLAPSSPEQSSGERESKNSLPNGREGFEDDDEVSDDTREEDDDEDYNDGIPGGEHTGFLGVLKPQSYRGAQKVCRSMGFSGAQQQQQQQYARAQPHRRSGWDALLHRTLLPDTGLSIQGHSLLESSGFVTKLLKFICWTFLSIALVHVIVAHMFDDRDLRLKMKYIWRYETDLIVRDCFVFFVVGRLWEKPGVDHLAWMVTAALSNVYFESQNFVWFLQHSVALFEMHCIWPWELWMFALVLVVAAGGLVGAHALKAYKEKHIGAKLTELFLCVFFFMAPMITSDYFHLHHWYAGWLMGMQFNYDVWWSRLAMAWCWGMYVNGIAVYGRDPVLTCEYSYWLTLDNRCPYIACYLEGLADVNNTNITEMVPVDWRNCSATDDYHP